MAALPTPGGSDGTWGDELNEFLEVVHEADGTILAGSITNTPAGTIAATDLQTAVNEVATDAASALSTHEADTTSVHGISNTANLYASGGTDVAVADGGTGASTALGARDNLGIATYALAPANAVAESFPRYLPQTNAACGASGELFMTAVTLRAGQTVTSLTFCAGVGATNPTHQFGALYSSALALLASSADGTTGAWNGNSNKVFTMQTPYVVPTTGLYYAALLQVADTPANPIVINGSITTQTVGAFAPTISGVSSTGLSTTLPDPAASITVHARYPYILVL